MNTEKLKEKRKHVEARLLGDRVAGMLFTCEASDETGFTNEIRSSSLNLAAPHSTYKSS